MTAPLAVTMGEPAGIGGELTVKAWQARAALALPAFVALDDPDRLAALGATVRVVDRMDASGFTESLPVLPVRLAAPNRAGAPDPANGAAVIGSIRRAVELALAGAAAGVVTNPIHKAALYAAGFRHPGHTEFLAELTGRPGAEIMMLACEGLRVVPLSIHQSLAHAVAGLDGARIECVSKSVADALRRDYGIAGPRLAVAGLNPHAGEAGALGHEEIDVIAPAVARLRAGGLEVLGPMAPDSMFHAEARARYDAAICMYHDQALIPLKTLDFFGGVNVTLGLTIVRTSPDHGTAFDIAGTGTARIDSFVAALRMAAEIAKNRTRSTVTAG
jgi:4-hydroxythreonine-4-phosphate dehydrogenase